MAKAPQSINTLPRVAGVALAGGLCCTASSNFRQTEPIELLEESRKRKYRRRKSNHIKMLIHTNKQNQVPPLLRKP